jgi:hypothetical protein
MKPISSRTSKLGTVRLQIIAHGGYITLLTGGRSRSSRVWTTELDAVHHIPQLLVDGEINTFWNTEVGASQKSGDLNVTWKGLGHWRWRRSMLSEIDVSVRQGQQ